jgi:hypothetical protein
MNYRTLSLGLASAVTTFLLVGALSISVLGGLYGDSPGVGILGVLAGLVAGLVAGGVVAAFADRPTGLTAAALVAYATFGVAFLAIAALQYINAPGADAVFTFPVHLGTSVVVAVVVAAAAFRRRGRPEVAKPSV